MCWTPFFTLYMDIIYLILTQVLRVHYYYSSPFTDEKLGHREIGETLIQSESQKSAFSTTTLFCLLEMGRLSG